MVPASGLSLPLTLLARHVPFGACDVSGMLPTPGSQRLFFTFCLQFCWAFRTCWAAAAQVIFALVYAFVGLSAAVAPAQVCSVTNLGNVAWRSVGERMQVERSQQSASAVVSDQPAVMRWRPTLRSPVAMLHLPGRS
jgi:hypothetical protein